MYRGLTLLLLLVMVCPGLAHSASVNSPKMRPYCGIGIVVLQAPDSDPGRTEPFNLYEEPGIFRRGELDSASTSANEWIFGMQKGRIPLIVTARKGSWLKVCYDDAGREAWIDPQRRGIFQSWDQFLKGQMSRLLPALRKQQYQMYRQPARSPLAVLTPKHLFKVLKLENDWAMIMCDQNTIGWVRWRDEDGRLLVGPGSDFK